jgi:hypothetical protein
MSDFASHYASLSDDDLARSTADIASLLPEAREALKTEAEKRNLPTEGIEWTAQRPPLSANLPYSWGRFQGWMMLVCGILGFFEMAGKGHIFGIAAASLTAVIGLGLIRRVRWGFTLFFIGTGITILIALIVDLLAVYALFSNSSNTADVVAQALTVTTVNVLWWFVPAVTYYRKRIMNSRNQ